MEEKEEKHYCTLCPHTFVIWNRSFVNQLLTRYGVYLPWSASSSWCRIAWWSTLQGLARRLAHWRPRKMCKPWRWRCPLLLSACRQKRTAVKGDIMITNIHERSSTRWRPRLKPWERCSEKRRVHWTHQNLNSGNLLMKGRNSSFCLVGRAGPSSAEEVEQHSNTLEPLYQYLHQVELTWNPGIAQVSHKYM